MTDALTAAIAQETTRLLRENPNFLSQPRAPQEIAAAITQRGDWLSAFEAQLEERLQQAASRVIERWGQEMQQEFTRLQARLVMQNPAAGGIGTSPSPQTGIANAAATLFSGWLNRERISQSESDQSRSAAQRYRQSRGQMQTQLASELSRGKRYQ